MTNKERAQQVLDKRQMDHPLCVIKGPFACVDCSLVVEAAEKLLDTPDEPQDNSSHASTQD